MKCRRFLAVSALVLGSLSAQSSAPQSSAAQNSAPQTQSSASQSSAPQSTPPPDPRKEMRYSLGLVETRTAANFQAADSIEANLAAEGSTLHPQLVTLRLRIQAALDEARKALAKDDLGSAGKAIQRAEAMLDRFAAKIGGS
jgi:hypothetical protein